MPPPKDFTTLRIYKTNQFWSRDIGKTRGGIGSVISIFNLFSGGCCKSVKAEFTTFNDAWFQQDSKFGYYKLQQGKTNGKPHYISSDGKNGIWYTHGKWVVGRQKDKATRNVSFSLKSYADCPTEPHDQLNWRYVGSNGKMRNAGKGFKIVCKN